MSRLCRRKKLEGRSGSVLLTDLLRPIAGFPQKTLNTKFTSYETDKHKCGGCNTYVCAKRAHPPH